MTRSLRVPRPIAALLLLGAMAFGATAHAQASKMDASPFSASPSISAPIPAAFGGPNLVLDDGTAENNIGVGGAPLIWCNRFTPPPGDFPIQIISADFLFDAGGTYASPYDIFVYSDPDGDPANGATFVGSSLGQAVTSFGAFLTSTFSTPLDIAAAGDVLICGRSSTTGAGIFPAAIDQTATQGRSWAGFGTGTEATPVVLPVATWGTIDGFGFPGNWMIRGTYTAGGSGSALLLVSPSSVNFGGVDVGDTGGPTSITITNTGTLGASISSISTSAPFSVNTGGTSMTLSAGASTTFDVSFSPSAVGVASGTVTITSDAANSPSSVALSGTGTDPDVETFPSTDTPIAVPDGAPGGTVCGDPGAPAVSTISVAGVSGTVVDLDLLIDISATWIGDVEATLSHGATSAIVIDNPGAATPTACGNSSANYPGIILDDAASNSVQTGPFPLVAGESYAPAFPLSAFNGDEINGAWALSVTDGGEGDVTTLNSWALIITPEGTVEPGVIDQTVVRQPAGPVPASGGDARIAFRFTNLTDAPISTTTWATLSIPGDGVVIVPGTDLELLMRPKPLNLEASGDPADNRRWGMRFQLLAEAPEGDYVYTRYAGDQNGDVLVSESVTFTKSGAAATSLPSVASEAPDADEAVVQIGADGAVTIIRGEGTESASTTQAASELRVSPNPMTTQGQAMLRVATTQEVRVALYDALGREVRVLFERSLTAGQQAYIGFRTADLPAGVYVVRATGADLSLTERITVVR